MDIFVAKNIDMFEFEVDWTGEMIWQFAKLTISKGNKLIYDAKCDIFKRI